MPLLVVHSDGLILAIGPLVIGVIVVAVVAIAVAVAYLISNKDDEEEEAPAPVQPPPSTKEAQKENQKLPNQPVNNNKQGCSGSKPAVTHAALQLHSVTFTGNHVVNIDTLGDFPKPEWEDARAQQSPVCYTRGKTVQLTAKFKVTQQPSSAESVVVKGKATVGAVTLNWQGTINVAPGAAMVDTPLMTSAESLPNEVTCVDAFSTTWEANPANTAFSPAGASSNLLYLTLADPSGTPAYWTLLDISCRAAQGKTTPDDLVSAVFQPFTTRKISRKRDGKGLVYWKPNVAVSAMDTKELLSLPEGSGQCGSWSTLLLDMYRVHGITSGIKVIIAQHATVLVDNDIAFLVKNWKFNHPPASSATAYTHELWTECVEESGVAGQRNANPPPAFFNHFIVKYDTRYYDPSYGSGPFADSLTWENASIDGLANVKLAPQMAGYDKALPATGQLLYFWNADTGAPL